jgi:hypothetical protein
VGRDEHLYRRVFLQLLLLMGFTPKGLAAVTAMGLDSHTLRQGLSQFTH